MKNEIIKDEIIDIKNMIYEIDDKEVMLDSDLAKLYGVETKRINEAVNRNKEKFPERISKVLTDKETDYLWSQNATANISNKSRVNPRVFTEQGIYMLATILKSKTATEVSIRIMDTFVKMRHYINYNNSFLPHKFMLLENKVDKNTKRIDELFDKFNPKDIAKDSIFFEGHFYDAYSFLIDIFNRAKEEIIIIDNYASKKLLDMIKNFNLKITIVSKNIDPVLMNKYLKQYKNVSFVKNDSFHDRFIIIDNRELYTSGASFKDIGKKGFYIGKIDNIELLHNLLNNLDL